MIFQRQLKNPRSKGSPGTLDYEAQEKPEPPPQPAAGGDASDGPDCVRIEPAEINLFTESLLHSGQTTFSFEFAERVKSSKTLSQEIHLYS